MLTRVKTKSIGNKRDLTPVKNDLKFGKLKGMGLNQKKMKCIKNESLSELVTKAVDEFIKHY
jgi:hypothetical protein